MNETYTSCAVVNGQSLCVARNSESNAQFPILVAECGGMKKS
jgi:hypothetical protein